MVRLRCNIHPDRAQLLHFELKLKRSVELIAYSLDGCILRFIFEAMNGTLVLGNFENALERRFISSFPLFCPSR